ncbi:MAG TPA: hypothetical protein VGR96_00895 [Acidobacteriaceae bacterium]|nr:hypothetical protein [Acidobacteriaceae bacterium]
MRTSAIALLLPAVLLSGASGSNSGAHLLAPGAPDPSVAQIKFSYENTQLQPARYVLTVGENGSGRYRSEAGSQPPADKSELPVRGQDREIRISQATREKMFQIAKASRYFAMDCDGGGNHVAFQGTKTLEFRGAEGQGSCTYNWTKNKQIQLITDDFQAISLTLEEGARLDMEYEHSRLSLDPELELLAGFAKQGRAIELENIAPVLEKVAKDDAILKRAQRRARELLAIAKDE